MGSFSTILICSELVALCNLDYFHPDIEELARGITRSDEARSSSISFIVDANFDPFELSVSLSSSLTVKVLYKFFSDFFVFSLRTITYSKGVGGSLYSAASFWSGFVSY